MLAIPRDVLRRYATATLCYQFDMFLIALYFAVQYDPKGWVWETLGYQRAMLREVCC